MSDQAFDPSRDERPAGPSVPSGSEKILQHARKVSLRDNSYWKPIYDVMEDDQLFLAGRQWDVTDVQERNLAGHVTLTINDLPQYLDQIVGDMRMNPTQVRIRPADWGASRGKFISQTGKKYDPADVRAGLIRQIEYKSNAPVHYNLAGQAAAETGLGWLRVRADHLDDHGFGQDIIIERVKNRWSVLIDSMAQQPDFSDARHGFVSGWMDRDEYNERWPGTAPAMIGSDQANWWSRKDFVRVAEFMWREEEERRLVQLDNGEIIRSDNKAAWEAVKELPASRIINVRKVKVWCVYWCKMSYHHILEAPRKLPGQYIPLVPVIGKRLEGSEDDYFFGITRFAKEPKRMENYWLSSATERISLMPTSPWIGTAAMFKGHETAWAAANSGTAAFLMYNVDPDAGAQGGKPERVAPPTIPAGEMQMMLAFGEKVKAAVGFHDAGIGQSRNDQSGVAIERLQRESDVGAYVFTDNLRIAIMQIGKIANQWLPSIYDVERFISIRHENGETDTIQINYIDENGVLQNDLTVGRYDVHVDTGPAYTTIRAEAATVTLELMGTLAQLGQGEKAGAIADIAVENMDIPGSERMAKRLRKLVPPHIIDPTELSEEERNAPPPPPSPEQIAQNAMAEALSREAQTKVAEAQSREAEAQARIATAEAAKATAEATIAKAKATSAQAEADFVQTIVGSPEAADQADHDLAESKRKEAAEEAATTAKPAAGMSADDIKELVANSVAEAIAALKTGGPDNGRRTGRRPARAK